jgi:glutaredoxin
MFKKLMLIVLSALTFLAMTSDPVYSSDGESIEDGYFTLYSSSTCPYCISLKEFIEEHELENQVEYKEVLGNEELKAELKAVQSEVGGEGLISLGAVPYMIYEDDGKKIGVVGEAPIREVLAEKNGIDISEDVEDDYSYAYDDSEEKDPSFGIGSFILFLVSFLLPY